jgi:hypothetical protein
LLNIRFKPQNLIFFLIKSNLAAYIQIQEKAVLKEKQRAEKPKLVKVRDALDIRFEKDHDKDEINYNFQLQSEDQ